MNAVLFSSALRLCSLFPQRSYAKIIEYIQGRNYEILLPVREVYIKGPGMIFRGNPKKYLTEIQVLISKPKGARHD